MNGDVTERVERLGWFLDEAVRRAEEFLPRQRIFVERVSRKALQLIDRKANRAMNSEDELRRAGERWHLENEKPAGALARGGRFGLGCGGKC